MDRELEYWPPGTTQPVSIRVRIDIPKPDPEHDWQCAYAIEGFPDEPHYARVLNGADPIEALSYVLGIIPLVLRTMTPRGGRLTWQGAEDLRFPSMFAEPSQEWRWTPAGEGEPRELRVRIGLPERIDEQWSALVTCVDCETWQFVERRIEAGAWAEALERAAASVPGILQEQVDKLGAGTLEEVLGGASCAIS